MSVVPKGKIAVNRFSYPVENGKYWEDFTVKSEGHRLDSDDIVLDVGQETTASKSDSWGDYLKHFVIQNIDGEARIFRFHEKTSEEEAVEESLINKIVKMGFPEHEARQILIAAGSDKCVTAVEWTIQSLKIVPTVLLNCVLKGLCDGDNIGWDKTKSVIEALGIEAPEANSATEFFKILRGAHIAITNEALLKKEVKEVE